MAGRTDDGDARRSATDAAEEMASLRPYLGLARAIRDEVDRFVRDDAAPAEAFALALDRLRDTERSQVVIDAFDALPPQRRWEVVARLTDDDTLREVLAARIDQQRREAGRVARVTRLAAAARAAGRLDLTSLPGDLPLEVGLFRPVDVSEAVRRGHLSTVCARLLVLRTTDDPPVVRVLDDRFNPRGGLFVGADYDEAAWREERLDPHEEVRLGSLDGEDAFEPVLWAGSRVDRTGPEGPRRGRLHLGWVLLDGVDVFVPG